MSGGRVELGLGAGWFDDEHAAYGIPFPPLGERFDRLAEQLAVITGLWETPDGETFSHAGTYYAVRESPALPKPVQRPRPPVVIGGHGASRTPKLAARYAQEFNLPFGSVADFTQQRDRVRAACDAVDRDTATMTFSVALVACCGTDEAEIERRAANIGREVGELRANGAAGTPDEVVATLRRYADAGASRAYLQVLDVHDLDHLALLGETVLPAVA
jgi:alkanesulfonate monooxygenase SsuD/methylene tetrahydromethanopterin reductase-like flavin-dependent oxidoreductase (luciferase family)